MTEDEGLVEMLFDGSWKRKLYWFVICVVLLVCAAFPTDYFNNEWPVIMVGTISFIALMIVVAPRSTD